MRRYFNNKYVIFMAVRKSHKMTKNLKQRSKRYLICSIGDLYSSPF